MVNSEENTKKEEKKPKFKFQKRYLIIIFTVLAVVTGAKMILDSLHYQITEDAYVESHMVQISPKVSGQITDVFLTDNQKIEEGAIVAKIDDADYKVRLEQAEANYQRALLGQNVAKANLNAVNSEIGLAKRDLERYKNLYATGAVSKQVLDDAQIKFDSIQAKHTNADQAVMSSGNKKVADADIKALKALRDQAKLNLDYTTIKALRGGTVTNKKLEKGAYVNVGQPLFVIVPDEVWVVANFKENQVGLMKPGQPVEIEVDAYPGKIFKGKIDSIQRASGAKSSLFPPENAVGSFVKIVQRIPVKIVFDEKIDTSEYTIVPGMSVIPKVKVR